MMWWHVGSSCVWSWRPPRFLAVALYRLIFLAVALFRQYISRGSPVETVYFSR